MKHDDWRHDPAKYAAAFTIEPRWADVDTLRHLNNSALHGLHQEARMRFLAERIGDGFWRERGTRLLAHRVATDFLLQSHYPQPLLAAIQVTALDERQLTLGSGLFQGGRCVGLQSATLQPRQRNLPCDWPAQWLGAFAAPVATHAEPLPAASAAPPVPDAFTHHRSLDSRFADLDATGRTSELAWMRGAESGRSVLLREAFATLGEGAGRMWLGLLAARVDLHVLQHAPAPPSWQLGVGVTHLGRSSVVVRVAFFGADRSCMAYADCVQVFVDRGKGTPVAMPEAVRALLDRCRVRQA